MGKESRMINDTNPPIIIAVQLRLEINETVSRDLFFSPYNDLNCGLRDLLLLAIQLTVYYMHLNTNIFHPRLN